MRLTRIWLTLCLTGLLCLGAAGCSGKIKEFFMNDAGGRSQKITFPNGAVLGGASGDQAQALAEILVQSHNMSMKELAANRKISRENQDTLRRILALMEATAKSQGAGEITLFFRTGSSRIARNSLAYRRLVGFVDFIGRQSKGRKVHFVLIGSASATGRAKTNMRLSQKRASAPMDIIDKYLVNLPHDFYRVNGVGDMYSPRKASGKINRRYQHVRIIAFYQTDTLPPLPPETKD